MEKLCSRCGLRPRHPRTRSRNALCLRCIREKNRESRLKDPRHRAVWEAKDGPCVDCGVRLPQGVMELDHVRGEKKFGLSYVPIRDHNPSLEEVIREIAKCDVRCPNCHRMRHWREWNEA